VIQDGNYGDFERGAVCAFALEFWPGTELAPCPDGAASAPRLDFVRGCTYAVRGQILFKGADWFALDAGVGMYCCNVIPPRARIGDWVQGDVSVFIDHFSYFESLSREAGAPPLIYDWQIASVSLETTPWIQKRPRYWERDQERTSWREVVRTNAWEDDSGNGFYVLSCDRQPGAARHRRNPN